MCHVKVNKWNCHRYNLRVLERDGGGDVEEIEEIEVVVMWSCHVKIKNCHRYNF